ncbi:MAG TPA: hypothetical protein P5510_07705 [Clostridia bacterium]|nr:hypothetical protein [Clostridia bacterium]
MSKINIPREMVKNLVEISSLLEEELKDVVGKEVKMEKHGVKRTVCAILRDIYDSSDSEEIKNWCVEATVLSKKMAARLVGYKKTHNELQKILDSIKK